uniref:Uncharacterized protein n=1 Tax=viral metagenome TaxID=1070528 RepID=A0A6M3JR34_9ZZZZ
MTNATPRALPENCACRGCGAAAYDRACPRLRLRRMAEAGTELKDALFAYQHRNDSEPVEVIEAENRIDRAIAAYEKASK